MEDRSVLTREAPEPNADLYLGGGPLVLLIHGGFWRPDYDRIHVRPMASGLRDHGWDVASIEYTRIPGLPDATMHDIHLAVTRLKPSVIVGHSAGGHLALWASATLGIPAVALAPVADLQLGERLNLDAGAVRDFLGCPASQRPDLDPVLLDDPGAVLIHGSQDTIVPIGLSESYVGTHSTSRLVALPDNAHFELIDPRSNAWPIVIHELERLLA